VKRAISSAISHGGLATPFEGPGLHTQEGNPIAAAPVYPQDARSPQSKGAGRAAQRKPLSRITRYVVMPLLLLAIGLGLV
jgi:hypothetical protein